MHFQLSYLLQHKINCSRIVLPYRNVCLTPFCQKEFVFTVLSAGCQSLFCFTLIASNSFSPTVPLNIGSISSLLSDCNIYTYQDIFFSDYSPDIISFIIDLSLFYFIVLIFISPVIQQSFLSKFHRIYVIFRTSLQLKPLCLAAFSQSVCQLR